jgi:hypothetical protein
MVLSFLLNTFVSFMWSSMLILFMVPSITSQPRYWVFQLAFYSARRVLFRLILNIEHRDDLDAADGDAKTGNRMYATPRIDELSLVCPRLSIRLPLLNRCGRLQVIGSKEYDRNLLR